MPDPIPSETAAAAAVDAPSRLSRGRKLLFVAIINLVLLLVLELLARGVCSYRFSGAGTDISIQGGGRWIAHPVLIWDNRPGYLVYGGDAQFNELGMRVRTGEIAMPGKGANDFWVFLLGGSSMFGMGAAREHDFARISGVGDHPIAQSIHGFLEKALQDAMPGKKVRVFNAAVASHTLVQSRLKYELLRHLAPDWVVSMDGVNDPNSLEAGQDGLALSIAQWTQHRRQRFPLAQGLWLMAHSGLGYLVGEYLYFHTNLLNGAVDVPQDPQLLQHWLTTETQWSSPPEEDAGVRRAVEEYLRNLARFRETLAGDGQKHLLLLQPYLSMRDPAKLGDVERACFHYLKVAGSPQPAAFMGALHREVARRFPPGGSVYSMDGVHRWDGWVFVDYCHFTADANRRIAEEISRYLLQDGSYRPFP